MSKTCVLPIRTKTFEGSFREFRLSELTFVSLYVLLMSVACRLYLRTTEEMVGGDGVFGELHKVGPELDWSRVGLARVVRGWAS